MASSVYDIQKEVVRSQLGYSIHAEDLEQRAERTRRLVEHLMHLAHIAVDMAPSKVSVDFTLEWVEGDSENPGEWRSEVIRGSRP